MTASESTQPVPPRITSTRAAGWAFGAYVVVAGPLLLHLGSFFWFFRDDWFFITDRELSSVHDLFTDHNSHWVTLPVIVFRLLYAVFGIRTYVPYQMVVIGAHLGVVVALRAIMRRAGVGPWLATAMAGSLVLFGPGREDILWAFQMGFTAAVLLGLGQILLADHDGPLGRRDALGLCLGIVALTSTGTGVAMALITGLALLIRRGVKVAAIHTLPLAVTYGAWTLITDPGPVSTFGRPTPRAMYDWVLSGQIGTFTSLGHYTVVAWALLVMLVVGLAIALFIPNRPERVESEEPRHRFAALVPLASRTKAVGVPLALLAGSVAFMLLTAQARSFQGPMAARAGRYLYLGAVLTIPALAVAAEAIARAAGRWRPAAVALAIMLILAAVPANIGAFDDPPFSANYHRARRELLTAAVRVPYARKVDPTLRPIADPYVSPGLTMGFLLFAYDHGKLEPFSGDIGPRLADELDVRLGLAQSAPKGFPASCRNLTPSQNIKLPRGAQFVWNGLTPIKVRPVHGSGSKWTVLEPRQGNLVTVARAGTEYDWEPVTAYPNAKLCRIK